MATDQFLSGLFPAAEEEGAPPVASSRFVEYGFYTSHYLGVLSVSSVG